MNKYLIIDFDSTFVRVESLDLLASMALEGNPQKQAILNQIEEITRLGMEGKIGFDKSLSSRLKLFSIHKSHISQLVNQLQTLITPSILTHHKFFLKFASFIYIVSGGFKEYILPITQLFGIADNHVFANEFIFDNQGYVLKVKPDNPLAQRGGKVVVVNNLKLPGTVHMIGDGMTDYQVKQSGAAHEFYAFVENIQRPAVIQKADLVVENFSEVVKLWH